VHGKWRPEHE
jgi:hypothetical protein